MRRTQRPPHLYYPLRSAACWCSTLTYARALKLHLPSLRLLGAPVRVSIRSPLPQSNPGFAMQGGFVPVGYDLYGQAAPFAGAGMEGLPAGSPAQSHPLVPYMQGPRMPGTAVPGKPRKCASRRTVGKKKKSPRVEYWLFRGWMDFGLLEYVRMGGIHTVLPPVAWCFGGLPFRGRRTLLQEISLGLVCVCVCVCE